MQLDWARFPHVVAEHLDRACIPVWSLEPGLMARRGAAGLTILDRFGVELVLIPWAELSLIEGPES